MVWVGLKHLGDSLSFSLLPSCLLRQPVRNACPSGAVAPSSELMFPHPTLPLRRQEDRAARGRSWTLQAPGAANAFTCNPSPNMHVRLGC